MKWSERAGTRIMGEWDDGVHYVRRYPDRLAVSRFDNGRLAWNELQAVKEALWGDEIAVEIYPAAEDVVNLRHTRHLWRSEQLTDAVLALAPHPEFCDPELRRGSR